MQRSLETIDVLALVFASAPPMAVCDVQRHRLSSDRGEIKVADDANV